MYDIFDDEKNRCNIYQLDPDSRFRKILRIRNHLDLNLPQVKNHRLLDLIVYKDIAEECRRRIAVTLETGTTTFAMLPVRLPVSGDVITRAARFEKRAGDLLLFVEPELFPEKPKTQETNFFTLDQHGSITSILITTHPDPDTLIGLNIAYFFPYPWEAEVIRKYATTANNTDRTKPLRATFQYPKDEPIPVICKITPFMFPEILCSIKEIVK